MKKLRSSTISSLRDASSGLLHQIGLIDIHDECMEEPGSFSGNSDVNDPPPSYKEATGGLHVMLSYNWDHQERVIKIRDRLSERGYSVWMDVDKMRK